FCPRLESIVFRLRELRREFALAFVHGKLRVDFHTHGAVLHVQR
ncbi:hypothetical protein CSUI_005740, partial [Cystoisospora suis]